MILEKKIYKNGLLINLVKGIKNPNMNSGHPPINEIAILQQQRNIGITEKNVINLKLKMNKVNEIKLSKKANLQINNLHFNNF